MPNIETNNSLSTVEMKKKHNLYNLFMRHLTIFGILLLAAGCVSSRPLIQSYGNPNLLHYDTFQLINLSEPNTSDFLRDNEILQQLGLNLMDRGYQFVNDPKDADLFFSISFLDDTQQVYVPPVTTIQTVSLPDTTTHFQGMASNVYNPFNTLSYSGSATTMGNTASVPVTRGGYFVNVYGVSVALNVYDAKRSTLIWSGVGGERADYENPKKAAKRIVDFLLKNQLLLREKIPKEKLDMIGIYEPITDTASEIGYYGDWKLETKDYLFTVQVQDVGYGIESSFSIRNKTGNVLSLSVNDVALEVGSEKRSPFPHETISEAINVATTRNLKYRPPPDPRVVDPNLTSALVRWSLRGIGSGLLKSHNQKVIEARNSAMRALLKNYLSEGLVEPEEYEIFVLLFPKEGISDDDVLSLLITVNGKTLRFSFRFKERISRNEYIHRLTQSLKPT